MNIHFCKCCRAFTDTRPMTSGMFLTSRRCFTIRANSQFVMLRRIRYEQHDYYHPHPKDGEGNVLTRVCLFTGPLVLSLVLSRGVPPSSVTGPLPQTGQGVPPGQNKGGAVAPTPNRLRHGQYASCCHAGGFS